MRLALAIVALIATGCGRLAFEAAPDADPDACVPGSPEVCDGLDNDCDPTTVEDCSAADCTPAVRPETGHRYLYCRRFQLGEANRATCAANGFTLAAVSDAAENLWIRGFVDATGTVDDGPMLGGTDADLEGTWRWPDGTAFWLGTSTGAPIDGAYAMWSTNEPNDQNGDENCLQLLPYSAAWNDVPCAVGEYRAVCER